MNNKSIINFAKYLWLHYPKLIIVGIISMIVGAMVDAAAALLIAPIFDLILQDQGNGAKEFTSITKQCLSFLDSMGLPQTSTFALILFLFIYLCRSLIAIFTGWLAAKVRAALTREMTVNTFKAVVNANWSFFLNRNQGEFLNSISRETPLVSSAYYIASLMLGSIFQIIFFAAVAMYVSWSLTLSCLGIAFIAAIPFIIISKMNYKWGTKAVVAAGLSNSITQESFSLAKVIQAFARQDESLERLEKQQADLCILNVKTYTLADAVHQLYYPLGLVSVIAGYYISRQLNIPFAELTIVFYALWKCIPFISGLLRNYSVLAQYLPSFENIRKLELDALADPIKTNGDAFESFKDSIELKDITFQYENTDNAALNGVSISIKKDKMIAFIGKSGSGKSTLVDLIMGFHAPHSGDFEIDDKAFDKISLQDYRSNIGYVPQSSVLFNSTIKENLLWAKPDASEEDIWQACEMANTKEFIQQLPNALETEVGDRGVRLSGGQIQRLAIARAILRKPQVLILDEATSALDSESEQLIQAAIENIAQSTTMIVIAHRLSTIKNADYIYVLDEGKVIEEGTYNDLAIDKASQFHKMLKYQNIDNVSQKVNEM